MTPPASPDDHTQRNVDRTVHRLTCPGVVAGAALRAARLSAGINEADLAAASGIPEDIIRSWEDGSSSLADIPIPRVEVLETTLRDAGADLPLVADLNAAAWCDLLLAALADRQDTACLLADPVASTDEFRDLLAWAAGGLVPARYRPYAASRQLLTDATIIQRVTHLLGAMPAQFSAARGSAV